MICLCTYICIFVFFMYFDAFILISFCYIILYIYRVCLHVVLCIYICSLFMCNKELLIFRKKMCNIIHILNFFFTIQQCDTALTFFVKSLHVLIIEVDWYLLAFEKAVFQDLLKCNHICWNNKNYVEKLYIYVR